MIVDMVRNDLGRVARAGSVAVRELFRCERYATLWQLTSTVTAESEAPLSAVLGALFPSASVTGAPKARTMALIAELEGEPRGVYTGTIGWAGPGGRARFNVAIRTVWIDRRRGVAEYGTGGGDHLGLRPRGRARRVTAQGQRAGAAARRLRAAGDDALVAGARLRAARGAPGAGSRARRATSASAAMAANGRRSTGSPRTLPPVIHRVRLLLARDGAVRVEAEPPYGATAAPPARVEAEPLPSSRTAARTPRRRWRVGLAPSPVDSSDPLLFHKSDPARPLRRRPREPARLRRRPAVERTRRADGVDARQPGGGPRRRSWSRHRSTAASSPASSASACSLAAASSSASSGSRTSRAPADCG